MHLVAGFSTAGMFLVVVAGVLAFFLPFYVMGIYNEAKNHGESNPGFWRERPITDIPSVQFYNALTAKPSIKTVCKSCAKRSIIFCVYDQL